MSASARVRLIGPIDLVSTSGEVHAPCSALRRTVLALLALRTAEVVSADWLLEHAWGDQQPESGVRALRFHISQLRRELPDANLIETRPGGYCLAVPTGAVDAFEAQALLRRARTLTEPSGVAAELEQALALWRGEPFIDAAPCALLDDEAQQLAELHMAILDDYYRARLELGAASELIGELGRLVADHPLQESLWSSLMTAQYRAGRQADALRSFAQMRVLLAETAGLLPSPQLQTLQARMLEQDPGLLALPSTARGSSRSVRGNLPAPATDFIDGGDRLGVVRGLVQDHRLVTLTGTGGVGKTRSAVELGWSLLDRFDGGVWIVELADVSHGDAVVAAVAATLSIQPQPSLSAVESILDWLHERQLLLIVDNCEHVLNSVRQLLALIVSRCPALKIVATSRERLDLAEEHVHAVNVLDTESEGVAFFLDRATAADSSFTANEAELAAIAQICQTLDGLPLAIELAAARVRSIGPADLLLLLDDRFRLLRRRGRKSVDRHDTLHATIAWSYRLLTAEERAALDRFSVFTGSFDLRAAEACVAGDADEFDVVDILSNLVEKSLVIADRFPDGTRYRILESIRQFGDAQLRERDATATTREHHLRHYLGVAEQADDLFRGPRQAAAALVFEREWPNFRTVHEWAILTRDLPRAERLLWLCNLYAVTRLRREHGEWAERTIALGTSLQPPQSATFGQAAFWAFTDGDEDRFHVLLDRGFEVAAAFDDPSAALCLSYVEPGPANRLKALETATATMDLDREWWVLEALTEFEGTGPDSQCEHLDRLVSIADRVRAPSLLVIAARQLGHKALKYDPPDYDAALEHYRRGLDIARDSSDRVSVADCLRNIAAVRAGCDPARAMWACRDALVSTYEVRYWLRIWQLFESIGLTLAEAGRLEAAAVVVGHLDAHQPPFGIEAELGFRTRTLGAVRRHPRVEEWMARGAAMDRHQIVQFALVELAE